MDAKSGSGGSGTFIWGLIAGIVVVLGSGGLYLSGMFGAPQEQAVPDEGAVTTLQDAQPADGQPEEQAADSTELAIESTEPAAQDAPAESVEQAPTVVAPVLDQIFVEHDGNTLLSGNAEPGSEVSVLLDGETVHSFVVDESGQFAEFLSIPFADDARGLVLQTRSGEETSRSDDYLIAALPSPVTPDVPAAPADGPVADATEAQTTEAEATGEGETEVAESSVPAAADAETATEPQPESGGAADQQIAILRSGEEGVELVQPPSVQDTPPKQIALDTIGYSDTGDVKLTGRARDGSAVRLYLDNQLVADLAPATDGQWRGEVEGIDPGVYTLRVDEVAPDGTVVSRLETPFKREPIETLRAVEANEPGDTLAETPAIRSVTVQKGDTLWAISRDRFGDGVLYVKLFEANKNAIRNPDLIYPGQIFTIPE
ncbi:Nucleoid-associated protein YgaU, contains BON and LysM domains [Ruegeria halocynthiae]|uniref:Nucleoid-associated protein YgaU, contains BON and LysM domains n=1 Tax=Ruegeria halocynthiae TaxID=985054 RepID=A0A1H2S164_9RHOB|nr:LysM peptidoglycan-binding domain-containing protein [Ruegeria halocynthiae]SDW25353.1 Nucleoid-associated protein YgaU, contains BON and LysM domains [Ruegeria halocynthiae]